MVLNLSLDDDIDLCCVRLNSIIINAAEDSLPKSEGKCRMSLGGMKIASSS